MPGRKSLLMITPMIVFPDLTPFNSRYRYYRSEYSIQMNRLADEALRAGLVIHVLDINGLTSQFQSGESILAKKTGGVTVKNSNFFVSGLGYLKEEMKGYYMISYVPPANTFKPRNRDKYQRVKIKVKRKFSEIHTRDGFYGTTMSPENARPDKNGVPLREAIFSPFLYEDLKVHLASGYAKDPETGYFLRSWVHLESLDLVFIDEQDGGHAFSLEIATVTTDINGRIHDSKIGTFDGYIQNEYLDGIKRKGISFDLYLPVKEPGAYYVRIAVKDRASGKIGTAYRFLEIPDLKKKRLSLSSIFVLNNEVGVSGIGSEDTEGSTLLLSGQEGRKSPAVRSYLPGEGFDYAVFVYNSKKKKGVELEAQFILFKDDEEFLRGDIIPISFENTDDFFSIPIVRKLLFKETIDPGNYVFQLTVTDKQAKKKDSIATQVIDFEIHKKE